MSSPRDSLHSEYEARLRSPNRRTSTASNASNLERSPSKERYSDRFIPSRTATNFEVGFDMGEKCPAAVQLFPTEKDKEENVSAHTMLLKGELLGYDQVDRIVTSDGGDRTPAASPSKNFLKFRMSPSRNCSASGQAPESSYSLSPITFAPESERFLPSANKIHRKISKIPFKVLDAPALQDDFYLDLVDWSSQNTLAVGLASCVYLWSAYTSKVTKLVDYEGTRNSVASVSWSARGNVLAVGTSEGLVELWDVVKMMRLRAMDGHSGRVGALAWTGSVLSTGSRDRTILHRDVRLDIPFTTRLTSHRQEVCGLQWSPEGQWLASGGNDNKLFIWTPSSAQPIMRFSNHTAAVKALAWSPHQHGLLASGGGTADRCLRFWSIPSSQLLNTLDSGSQVCNITWSRTVNELVSTHGYSQNQIVVWRYPSLNKLATLTGHTFRVLYLSLSPDGQTIVTGAGDETLRFWNVFPGSKSKQDGREQTLVIPPNLDMR